MSTTSTRRPSSDRKPKIVPPDTPPALQILLVEDNADDVLVINMMLKKVDMLGRYDRAEVLRVATLAEALTALAQKQIDVVLLDLSLPDADGLATFTSLHEAAPSVPVVVLSGLEDEELALTAVQHGAQDYLVKGTVGAESLSKAIRYAVHRKSVVGGDSQERFAHTLTQSSDPILIVDREGRALFSNPAAVEMLGVPLEHLGRPLGVPNAQTAELRYALPNDQVLAASVSLADTLWERRLGYLVSIDKGVVLDAADGAIASGEPLQRRLDDAPERSTFEGVISASPAMTRLFQDCVRIAPTAASVLVLGETGTGKELMARAIHNRSGRTGPFVAINCGAVPDTLIDAELFGHEKGSFTGATSSKEGLFRAAEGGTLLLDEVADLTPSAQLSLLRTLQERTVRPVGGTTEVPVNVRVIAATSRPLFEAVQAGTFREDLLYRLDVIRIDVLPLRERPEDILHLFNHFSRALAKRHDQATPVVGDGFLEAMLAYAWPGNVRQLENFAERLVLTGVGPFRDRADFQALTRPYGNQTTTERPSSGPSATPRLDLSRSLEETLDAVEGDYIREVLERCRGRVQQAAEMARVNRRTMLRKLKKHGIDKTEYM